MIAQFQGVNFTGKDRPLSIRVNTSNICGDTPFPEIFSLEVFKFESSIPPSIIHLIAKTAAPLRRSRKLQPKEDGSTFIPGIQCHHLYHIWGFSVRFLPLLWHLITDIVVTSVTGLYIAWRWRHQTKGQFLSSNRTQSGQDLTSAIAHPFYSPITGFFIELRADSSLALPIALNFIAAGECFDMRAVKLRI